MPRRKFVVRQAHPDELRAAGNIARDAYLLDGMITGENDYANWLADAPGRAALPGVAVLVAVVASGPKAGTVVGTITVAVAGSEFADVALPGELELRMLGVAHNFRGQGAGELLMREAIAMAHSRGLVAVLSRMNDNDKAARLYERLEFEHVPDRDWRVPEIPELGIMRVYRALPTTNPAQ